jgi:hypothetical protein
MDWMADVAAQIRLKGMSAEKPANLRFGGQKPDLFVDLSLLN